MEERASSRHTITLDKREKLSASGVMDVLSFDEENIVAQTDKGMLVIRGSNLHINNLNLDKGDLSVDGNISSLSYEEESMGGSGFLRRLFK